MKKKKKGNHTMSMDRVGEHMDATWKLVKRVPDASSARASMLGVWISEPKQPQSEKPRSSATMTRKLGLFSVMILAGWVHCFVRENSRA